jgi:hypothetical protein
MCRSLPGRWSVPLLLVLSTGCASSLQLMQEPPPYLNELRAEYLSSNPTTPFKQDIEKGIVVPGMDTYGVIAAWGQPGRRVQQDPESEQWTYMDVDSESGDSMEYALSFVHGILDRWAAHTHKQTGLAYRSEDLRQRAILTAEPPGGKKVPTN